MPLMSMPMIAPDGPAEAVVATLRDLQPALTTDHVMVTYGFRSSRYDLFSLGWLLKPDAPVVADHQVVVVEGEHKGGLWLPTGEPRPEVLTRGVICEDDDRGWVVAATGADGEGDIALIGHIRAYLDALDTLTEMETTP